MKSAKASIKRYAKMFLNMVGVDDVPGAVAELTAVKELMGKSHEFRGLLENPLFTGEERERILRKGPGGLKLSDYTIRLILHLSEESVIGSLPGFIESMTALYLEKKKRARAFVVTPIDTDRKYDDALKASLKRLTGRDIDLEYRVDPSLLGGLLVKVGSTMYDSSIKGQLRLLKDDLIKR
ncbi:MAG TPA: ATP synthase F1 subunit delta [Thermodesulfovibrionales bacterium]|nr:ATP synthase F1 subunit delta [Thermodesulfovibrionales bacterium]